MRFRLHTGWILCVYLLVVGCGPSPEEPPEQGLVLRVATYNIEDIWTRDLLDPDQLRLQAAARRIQEMRPDILLINEITHDQPGAPDVPADSQAGRNAQRFADHFLARAQGPDLEPIRYQVFMAPTNTGQSSGFDLDNDGRTVTTHPEVPPPTGEGMPAAQTAEGRAYGNDAWGFGIFPGQYGLALFVREGLDIVHDSVRTFRLFHWQEMPDPRMPPDWYQGEEAAQFRLSSKSHWDVPVRLPNDTVLHVLASHPTPPAFDGPEERNVRRNADEIRFWRDYLSRASYIRDDSSQAGGLPDEASFVIMGDLNADPDKGKAETTDAIQLLLDHPRVDASVVPQADSSGTAAFPDLDPDDTARWGRRVDYVLPSTGLRVLRSGIVRPATADTSGQVSDHFMVWVDLAFGSVEG